MEQMSHEAEERYLALHPDPSSRVDGYGVVLLNYCIRDLQGSNMLHHVNFNMFHFIIMTILLLACNNIMWDISY